MNQFICKVMGVLCLLASSHTSVLSQTPESFQDRIRVKLSQSSGGNIQSLSKDANGIAKTGIQSIDQLNESYGVKKMTRVFPYAGKFEEKHQKHGLHLWYVIYIDKSKSVRSTISGYGQLKEVEIAQPVYQYKLDVVGEALEVDDPSYNDQWHYDNSGQTSGTEGADISLQQAWNLETGDNNVVVSVHDSGIDTDHPDLVDVLWTNTGEVPGNGIDDDNNGYIDDVHGFNFWNSTGDVEDYNGHGSHTAGTIAAKNNNGYGVSGIAGGTSANDGVRVMMMRLGDNNGSPYIFNPAPSFVYAADMGATISSNSWGGGSYDQAIVDAINYFVAEAKNSKMDGGLVIFSAGNSSSSYPDYKSDLDNVLMVAASNHNDQKAWYSNYGDWIDLTAPGGETNSISREGVLSTVPGGGSAFYQGTSMACPHVSGVAALVTSYNGGSAFTNDYLEEILLTSTDSIDHLNPSYSGLLGNGRIDAYMALNNAGGIGVVEDIEIAPASFDLVMEQGITQEYTTKLINTSNVDLLIEITNDADWISFDETSITLREGDIYTLNFEVSTDSLEEGESLFSNIRFSYVDKTEALPVSLYVSGPPQISANDSIHFGTTYPNTLVTQTMYIQNTGFSDLVVDSIKVEGLYFTTNDTSFILSPGDYVYQNINFAPTTTDTVSAQLTIYSNDEANSEHVISLHGIGNPNTPPTVVLSETEISVSQSYQGYNSYPFDISNSGDDDLYVNLVAKNLINSLPDTINSTNDIYDYRYTTSDSEDLEFNWVEISHVGDSAIFTSSTDYLEVELDNPVLFNESYYSSIKISNKGYLTFGDDTHNSNVGRLRYGPIQSIVPLWHNYDLDEDSRVYYIELDDKFIVQYSNYGALDFNFQVIVFSDGNLRFQYLDIPEDSDAYISIGITGNSYYNYSNVNYGSIRYILKDEYAIHYNTGSAINYFSPYSAVISPGDTRTFYVNYDGYGVTPGIEHESVIRINNNSLEPVIDIPFKLSVSGQASLQVPNSLDFGSSFVDSELKKYVSIINNGTDTLTIDSIKNVSSKITLGDFDNTLLRGQELLLELTLDSSVPDSVFDTLTVYSNAVYQSTATIPIQYSIEKAPSIEVSPDQFSATLFHGEEFSDQIYISNLADSSSLDFSLQQSATDSSSFLDGIEGLTIAISDNLSYSFRNDLILKGANVVTTNYYNFDIETLKSASIWICDYDLAYYSSNNIDLIEEWIENGGVAIFLLSDYGEYNAVVQLISGSGINLEYGSSSYGNINDFSDHPINENVNYIQVGSRRTRSSGTGSAETIVRDEYGYGFASVGNKGTGRVMVISDNITNYWYYADNQTFTYNAIQWMSNYSLSISPSSGTISNIENESIALSFDSKILPAADTLNWLINVSHNDPDVEDIRIPVQLNIIANGYIESVDSISFNDTYVGTTNNYYLDITNGGSDSLTISSIDLGDTAVFGIDMDGNTLPATIAPDSTIQIITNFSPDSIENYTSQLTITSSDQIDSEYVIELRGAGLESSIIEFDPNYIESSLKIGETGTESFSVSSKGTDSLKFTLKIVERDVFSVVNEIGEEALSRIGQSNSITVKDADGVELTNIVSSIDQIAGIKVSNTTNGAGNVMVLGASHNVSSVADSILAHSDFISVSYTNVTYTTPTLNQLTAFDAILVYSNYYYNNSYQLGNVLASYVDQGGGVVTTVFENGGYARLNGNWLNGYRVFSNGTRYGTAQASAFSDHTITEDISLIEGYYRSYATSLIDEGEIIASWDDGYILAAEKEVASVKRVDLGLFPEDGIYRGYSNYEGFRLIANALDYVGTVDTTSQVSWAELDLHSGELPTGGDKEFTISFNAEGLEEANYQANVTIFSNDSRGVRWNIPISLEVTGFPNLEYDSDVEFEATTVGLSNSKELNIFNTGTGKILIDSVYTTDSTFIVANPVQGDYLLRPGKTLKLNTIFTPDAVEIAEEQLIIITEQDTISIQLSGEGLTTGEISIDSTELDVATLYGQTAETSLTIANSGDGILEYELVNYSDRQFATNQFSSGNAIAKGAFDPRPTMMNQPSYNNADSFGYTYSDSDSSSVSFEWIDISSSGTELTLEDDQAQLIELPFEIKLYGQRFSSLYVS